MQLLLIRHGIAETLPHQLSLGDDGRALSEQGHQRMAQIARGLKRLELRLDGLYHSPKLRAVQTANHLMGLSASSQVTSLLAQPPSEGLLKTLSEWSANSCVALVGHEPWMSELCAWLLTGHPQHGRGLLFRKGGVAWLQGDPSPGGMQLLAFLPPSLGRRLS